MTNGATNQLLYNMVVIIITVPQGGNWCLYNEDDYGKG